MTEILIAQLISGAKWSQRGGQGSTCNSVQIRNAAQPTVIQEMVQKASKHGDAGKAHGLA